MDNKRKFSVKLKAARSLDFPLAGQWHEKQSWLEALLAVARYYIKLDQRNKAEKEDISEIIGAQFRVHWLAVTLSSRRHDLA